MDIPFVKLVTIGILPSPLKRLYYRWKGGKVGKRASLGWLSVIVADQVEIGDDAHIAPFVLITCRRFKLGNRATIRSFSIIETGEFELGDDSTIMEQVVVGGMPTPRSRITIGRRVMIFPSCVLNTTEPITIEDDVGVGGASHIFTHGSWQSILDGFPIAFGPVCLKRGAWLPWRVFILPNVTIGEYATLGAGAVVNRDIPARSLAAGVPAKVLKTGAEYIKHLGEDEKHAIVLRILRDMAEYFTYAGTPTRIVDDSPSAVRMSIQEKSGEATLLYARAGVDEAALQHDVVISLEPLGDSIRGALTPQGRGWFDLTRKECGMGGPAWKEVRQFLGRYGLFFAVVDGAGSL